MKCWEIDMFFNKPDFQYCPSNTNWGEELEGVTSNDVLQDLLEDLNNKEFPFPSKTVENLNKKINESTPDIVTQRVESFLNPMIELLEGYEFKGETSKELVQSYEKLRRNIDVKYKFQQKDLPEIIHVLEEFLKEALRGSNSEATHAFLTELWKRYLVHFQKFLYDSSTRFVTRSNGTGKNLPVTLDTRPDESESDACAGNDEDDEDLLRPRPKGPRYVNVWIKPDLLFEVVQVGEGDDISLESVLFRSFCVEIKTTQDGFVSHCPGIIPKKPGSMSGDGSSHGRGSGSCSQSDGNRSWTSRGRKKGSCSQSDDNRSWTSEKKILKTAPMAPRMENLKTQLFLQLVALFKSRPQGLAVHQVHGIGFYVVMHRVYLTGVHLQPTSRRNNNFVSKIIGVCIPAGRKLDAMGYRMVCTKYFNMFKVEHLRALTALLKYLIFHQYKEREKF